jgi:hypothetical protein
MGYMRHHAIVVTSWKKSLLNEAHQKALQIFKWVSSISPETVNGYQSFFIPPDGSKEGWPDSDEGDSDRKEFIEWLDLQRYQDKSTPLDWVEIQYADEDYDNKITRHSDEKSANKE